MTKKIECPTCGVVRFEPSPNVRTTPWTDDCACSDANTCFYHRMNPYDDASCRPDEAVMEARAAKANEAAMAKYEEQKAKFEEAQRLKDQLAMAVQVSGELCEKCGWAMKFPEEPCRCELLDGTERQALLSEIGRLKADCDELNALRLETITDLIAVRKECERAAFLRGVNAAADKLDRLLTERKATAIWVGPNELRNIPDPEYQP